MSGLLLEDNRAVLKAFYEKKDPPRVKNVDPMFLRWDEEYILEAVQKKYGEIPNGWMSNGVPVEGGARSGRSDSSDSEDGKPASKKSGTASKAIPNVGAPPSAPPPARGAPPPPPPASAKPKIPEAAAPSPSKIDKDEEEKARQALLAKAEEERNRIAEEGRKKAAVESRQQHAASVAKEEPQPEKPAGRKTGFFSFGRKNTKTDKTPPKKATSPPTTRATIKEEPVAPQPPKVTEAPKPPTPAVAPPAPVPQPAPAPVAAPAPPQPAPPAPQPAPAAAAPALNIGAGAVEGGYKRPARGSPELAKYEKMKAAGLPQGAVENAMMRDGIHPAALFDDPLNNPTSGPKPVAVPKATPAPAAPKPAEPAAAPASNGGGAAKPPPGMSLMEEIKWKQQNKAAGGGGGGGGAAAPAPKAAPTAAPAKEAAAPAASTPKVSSALASRQAMLAGILGGGGGGGGSSGAAATPKKDAPPPTKKWPAVSTDGAGASTSESMKGAANALASKLGGGLPAAATSDSAPPADLSKYEKMAKMLPQGAVENAMVRDGVDPGYLFGENCITVKSDKRPVKAGGAAAAAPSAAPAAAAAPAPTPAPAAPAPVPQQPMAAAAQPQFVQQQQPQYVQQQQPQYGQQLPPQMMYAQQQPQMYQQPQMMMQQPQQYYAPTPQPMYNQPVMAAPQPMQQPLWVQVWSTEHNTIYYTNTKTGESSWYPPPGYQAQPQNMAPPPPLPSTQQRQIVQVLYNFNPTGANPQEMQVFASDQIEVYSLGADGWLTGRCLRTGIVGLVPANYTR